MKALSLAIALAVSAVAVAPATVFAQSAPAAAPAGAISQHGVKAGERMPGLYVATDRYKVKDVSGLGLPAAPQGFRWIVVEETAYLVQNNTDIVIQFRTGVKAAS